MHLLLLIVWRQCPALPCRTHHPSCMQARGFCQHPTLLEPLGPSSVNSQTNAWDRLETAQGLLRCEVQRAHTHSSGGQQHSSKTVKTSQGEVPAAPLPQLLLATCNTLQTTHNSCTVEFFKTSANQPFQLSAHADWQQPSPAHSDPATPCMLMPSCRTLTDQQLPASTADACSPQAYCCW
jgi:hypothetical protein